MATSDRGDTPASRALAEPPANGVRLLGYLDSDAAVQAIDRRLSARGIAFFVERPTGHWAGTPAQLAIIVAADHEAEVRALLADAVAHGELEAADGTTGLIRY